MAEKEDMVKMVEEIKVQKIISFDYMMFVFFNGFKNSGHKTVEEALIWTLKDYTKKCRRIENAFLKKYPDR